MFRLNVFALALLFGCSGEKKSPILPSSIHDSLPQIYFIFPESASLRPPVEDLRVALPARVEWVGVRDQADFKEKVLLTSSKPFDVVFFGDGEMGEWLRKMTWARNNRGITAGLGSTTLNANLKLDLASAQGLRAKNGQPRKVCEAGCERSGSCARCEVLVRIRWTELLRNLLEIAKKPEAQKQTKIIEVNFKSGFLSVERGPGVPAAERQSFDAELKAWSLKHL